MSIKYLLGILLVFPAAAMAQHAPGDQPAALQLTGYEVHLVKKATPYSYRTEKNELKQTSTAWLVLLNFKEKPAVQNSRTDFYIGDYRIPEYGGTSTGIYFRIYDPALLNKLNDQPISYQMTGLPKKSFDTFTFKANGKTGKTETEEEVLHKKK